MDGLEEFASSQRQQLITVVENAKEHEWTAHCGVLRHRGFVTSWGFADDASDAYIEDWHQLHSCL